MMFDHVLWTKPTSEGGRTRQRQKTEGYAPGEQCELHHFIAHEQRLLARECRLVLPQESEAMRTRYEAALKAALKKGEVPEKQPQRVTRLTSHVTPHTCNVTMQEREDKLPKSLPKKDARAQINDVRAFYKVNHLCIC